jgi:Protein of unknown function (DUF3126)
LIAAVAACYAAGCISFYARSFPDRKGSFSGLCSGGRPVDVQEVKKLDAYLKKLFGNARIRVVPRPKKDDSAEVYVGDEFVGVLFIDDEDDERSYNFQMAILATDLE